MVAGRPVSLIEQSAPFGMASRYLCGLARSHHHGSGDASGTGVAEGEVAIDEGHTRLSTRHALGHRERARDADDLVGHSDRAGRVGRGQGHGAAHRLGTPRVGGVGRVRWSRRVVLGDRAGGGQQDLVRATGQGGRAGAGARPGAALGSRRPVVQVHVPVNWVVPAPVTPLSGVIGLGDGTASR